MKRWVIIGAIVLVVVLGGFFFSRQKQANAEKGSVKTVAVKREDFVKTIQSSGKTEAKKAVELKFQTSGRLTWVGVKEGDRVNAYQAIASLDAREVQKTLQKTLIDYSLERNTFEDTSKYTYQANRAADAVNDRMKHVLEANQWDLEKAVLDVELKHLAVEFSTLITPIAGIVTHIDTPYAGVNITPSTSVFQILDPDTVIFEASIDEVDVGKLSPGMQADVALDAYADQTYPGTISFIAYAAEKSSGGATVFPVEITLAATASGQFRVGMNGDVSIVTSRKDAALVIPVEAIREDDGGTYVYKKSGNTYIKTPIVIAEQSETSAAISDGVSEGDEVVVKGFATLP